MMHNEDEISQAERRRIMIEERRLRTYHGHAEACLDAERQGRFATLDKPIVTGADAGSAFPQMDSGPWAKNELPDEPLVDGRGEGNVTGYLIDRPDTPPPSPEDGDVVGDGPTPDGTSDRPVIRRRFVRRI
jgi:hypothetical protein